MTDLIQALSIIALLMAFISAAFLAVYSAVYMLKRP